MSAGLTTQQISEAMGAVNDIFDSFAHHHCKHRSRILAYVALNSGLMMLMLEQLQNILHRQGQSDEVLAMFRRMAENTIESQAVSLQGTILELASLVPSGEVDTAFVEAARKQADHVLARLQHISR